MNKKSGRRRCRRNSRNSSYLAWQTLRAWDTVLPVIGFAISFVWLFTALSSYAGLFQKLDEPAVIRAEAVFFNDTLRQQVTAIDGIEIVTTYLENSTQMQWGDYKGSIQVYGVENAFLEWLSDRNLTADAPFSEGMPYGILSESAVYNLKKNTVARKTAGENTETANSRLVLTSSDLMKDFFINYGADIRLYGLIESSEAAGDSEALSDDKNELSGLFLSAEWFASVLNVQTDSVSGIGGDSSASVQLILISKSGHDAAAILKKLDRMGINGQCTMVTQKEEVNARCLSMLETGAIILVCSILILVYQEKLWKERHQAVADDIRRFSGNKNFIRAVFIRRRSFLLLGGLLGSLLWNWISKIYEIL